MSQIGSFPQVGVKKYNYLKPPPIDLLFSFLQPRKCETEMPKSGTRLALLLPTTMISNDTINVDTVEKALQKPMHCSQGKHYHQTSLIFLFEEAGC